MKFLKLIPLLLFLTQSSTHVAAQQAPLRITSITGDFYSYTTYNLYEGKYIPANGMYVVTNKGVVLLDSPWDSTQCQPLLDSIIERMAGVVSSQGAKYVMLNAPRSALDAITAILPGAPAIANAVFDAVGVRITELPITPEKVLAALRAQTQEAPHA